jgi:hypothetical protein
MKHVMIDLETLDTEISPHVLSVGACTFVPDIGRLGEEFYAMTGQEGQAGRTFSYDTVKWWIERSDHARREVFQSPSPIPLPAALMELAKWCQALGIEYFWANDPDFDISILRHMPGAASLNRRRGSSPATRGAACAPSVIWHGATSGPRGPSGRRA